MLKWAGGRTLSRLIAVRMILVAIAISSLLLVFFFVTDILDRSTLRRLTLEAEVSHIADAMHRNIDPADWKPFLDFPGSYGFRVTEIRPQERPRVIASANSKLLPADDFDGDDFVPGFGSDSMPSVGATAAPEDQWLLTDYDRSGSTVRWIQVAMVGDPAQLWVRAIAEDLGNRLLFPILIIVPALTVAVFFTTRQALRPLTEISRHARALGRRVTPGARFEPLPDGKLPLEFEAVMTAVNALLSHIDRALMLQKQFTSDVAHELRTPLAVLLLELSELPPSPEVERMQTELCSLRDIVNELLRFAQAEEAMAQKRQRVNISLVARRVCEELAAVAFQERKTIEFDAPEKDVELSGHATLIDVALRNLVGNAIKVAPRRSMISVGVGGDGSIVVEDRGPGVPDHQKKLIFDRFWHASSHEGGGTGIGLALVRRIALLHGGDVQVRDRPGGGACFVLTLKPPRPVVMSVETPARPASAWLRFPVPLSRLRRGSSNEVVAGYSDNVSLDPTNLKGRSEAAGA